MYSFCARDCCFVIMNSLIGPDGIIKNNTYLEIYLLFGGEGSGGKPGRGTISWQTSLNHHFFSRLVLWNSSVFFNTFNTVWNGIWFICMVIFLPCSLEKPRGAICDCVLIKAFFWRELLETGHKFFPPRASTCFLYSDFLWVVFPFLFPLTLLSKEY